MGKMTEEKKKRRKKRLLKREFEITDEDLRFFTEYEEYLEKLKEADPEFKKSSDILKTLLTQYQRLPTKNDRLGNKIQVT